MITALRMYYGAFAVYLAAAVVYSVKFFVDDTAIIIVWAAFAGFFLAMAVKTYQDIRRLRRRNSGDQP